MDILVRERGGHHDEPTRPGEARIWGAVAVSVVLGMLLIIAASGYRDRRPVRSDQTILVQKAPAPLVPDRVLP